MFDYPFRGCNLFRRVYVQQPCTVYSATHPFSGSSESCTESGVFALAIVTYRRRDGRLFHGTG